MLTWIREKFGTVVISSIIGFIAFVFIFYGVFSPKATRGLHDGAVAGTVNGESISISEFNRELNRRLEFFKNIGGGKLTDEQLKSFRIHESVFQELVSRKLLAQEAHSEKLLASDEEVKEKIQEIPAFQKEGKFDLTLYKKVLESNNYSPGSFEGRLRDDLSVQKWESYFKERVHVSEEELKREFAVSHNQRNIKYVLFTPESAYSAIAVPSEEIKKFLADSTKVNLAKMKFDRGKETVYRGKKFEAVQDQIAHDLIAADRLEEVQKINEHRADQVIKVLGESAAADKKVNALFPGHEIQVKTTGLINIQTKSIPGVGEAREVLKDAFTQNSPLDSKVGGKPKKYNLAGRVLVAYVIESKTPDFSQLEQEREKLMIQVASRKTRTFFESCMQGLASQAKIETNAAVVAGQGQ